MGWGKAQEKGEMEILRRTGVLIMLSSVSLPLLVFSTGSWSRMAAMVRGRLVKDNMMFSAVNDHCGEGKQACR